MRRPNAYVFIVISFCVVWASERELCVCGCVMYRWMYRWMEDLVWCALV